MQTQTPTKPTTPINVLCHFMGHSQRASVKAGLRGEERAYFAQTLAQLAATISAMPQTYEQDGKGDDAVVHLHYFFRGADWFITEKDSDPDGEGQHQAFGLADLFRDGGELGYISVIEITAAGAELDFHWTPKTLGEVKASRRPTPPPAPAPKRSRSEEFALQLHTLLEAIRHKAECQFAYNEQTNIPKGIIPPEESVSSAILHGMGAGWNTTHKWDCAAAIDLAYDVLEDANCHTEAARLRAA